MTSQICNNCGKRGHIFKHCKLPVISHGVIAVLTTKQNIKLLMVQRKHSFGYIDFIRGNYLLTNIMYMQRLVNEMTNTEKNDILTKPFKQLVNDMWDNTIHNRELSSDEMNSNIKFDSIRRGVNLNEISVCESIHTANEFINVTLADIVSNSDTSYEYPEWEFPKGKKNFNEQDLRCAIRELHEETGVKVTPHDHIVRNILPYEESFIGSNNKSYKYKYYVAVLDEKRDNITTHPQPSEISIADWKTPDECISCIRAFSHEKKNIVQYISRLFSQYYVCGS